LAPIKYKIMSLQSENRQLQADLVSVTDRMAARGIELSQPTTELKLDLPDISQQHSPHALTVLSHA
jgi:hypothetical protein